MRGEHWGRLGRRGGLLSGVALSEEDCGKEYQFRLQEEKGKIRGDEYTHKPE